MKAKDILTAIGPALDAAEPRATIPIARCVRFAPGSAIGTDFDLWAAVEIDHGLPEFCVNADALRKALSVTMAADAELSMTLDGERLIVKGGGRRASIATLPSREFPTPPDDEEWPIDVTSDELVAGLMAPSAAMSNNDARYYLNGVCWDGGNFAAYNGHVLVTAPGPASGSDLRPIFPRPVLAAIAKLGGNVRIRANEQRARIDGDGVSIVSRLIDGSFPDWRRIMPAGRGRIATINAKALLDIVKAVAWAGDDVVGDTGKVIGIGASFGVSADEMSASTQSQKGESTASCPATLAGEPLTFKAMPRNMEVALSAFPGDVELHFADGEDGGRSPILFTNGEASALLMPMRA